MSPITTLALVGVFDCGTSSHELRYLPVLREGQSDLLAYTTRPSYALFQFLTLAFKQDSETHLLTRQPFLLHAPHTETARRQIRWWS
jgi:hypothetical protein